MKTYYASWVGAYRWYMYERDKPIMREETLRLINEMSRDDSNFLFYETVLHLHQNKKLIKKHIRLIKALMFANIMKGTKAESAATWCNMFLKNVEAKYIKEEANDVKDQTC